MGIFQLAPLGLILDLYNSNLGPVWIPNLGGLKSSSHVRPVTPEIPLTPDSAPSSLAFRAWSVGLQAWGGHCSSLTWGMEVHFVKKD